MLSLVAAFRFLCDPFVSASFFPKDEMAWDLIFDFITTPPGVVEHPPLSLSPIYTCGPVMFIVDLL